MGGSSNRVDELRREIAKREVELADLKSQLARAESEKHKEEASRASSWTWPLADFEYERYSRQMIVPGFGLPGQLRLRRARVLLVGAGGLGCPAALYLAGAGVGTLGLVDGDEVEVSNLHRQIAHSSTRVGTGKVDSVITQLQEINPTIAYQAHKTHLTPQNAQSIVAQYDLVLDCTDHPTSRYLISDVCVLLAKPLISAAAFQTSGQLIGLNSPPGQGPCYRCVFPVPPPPDSVVGCGEGGIVGPVVGVMGVLQALEAIKMITGGLESMEVKTPTMLVFSGMGDTPFRSVRIRGKRENCFACGGEAGLTLKELETSLDYVQFCGVREPVELLQPEDRITASEYGTMVREGVEHLLLDVREKEQFGLGHIKGSVNVPISKFMANRGGQMPEGFPADISSSTPIYVVCRVGNDSQIAAQKLKDLGLDADGKRFIGDIKGGLRAWKAAVDPSIPFI